MNKNSYVHIPAGKKLCSLNRIGIFGSADIAQDHPVYQATYAVCQALASRGKIIIDGGGPGVMAAATLGAESVNGQTIAVTFKPVDMPEFEGRYSGNEPDLEIQTTDYISRMFGLIEESDAFIIFQGGTGTLSEWATVWLMAHLQYGNHRPIILYGDFWPNFMKVVKENFYVDEKEQSLYKFANSVDEVMQALNEFEVEVAKRCS